MTKSIKIPIRFDLMDYLDCDLPTIVELDNLDIIYNTNNGDITIEDFDVEAIENFLKEKISLYCVNQMYKSVRNVVEFTKKSNHVIYYKLLDVLEDMLR